MASEQDRRVHPRTPVRLRIAYDSAGVLKSDYVENISRGGLFIATEERFEVGQRFPLELYCVSTRTSIPLQATVRWAGTQSPGPDLPPILGIGVEFDEVKDATHRARLESLIDAAFEPAPRIDPRERLKILLVDPNHFARDLFRNGLLAMAREVFEVDGYVDVVEAEDGLEALELCRGAPFDLFIIELRTPEVDGAEIIRRVRRQVSQAVPIFAMSRPYPGDKADALSAGADVFVQKPVQLKPLFNTLKVLLKLETRRPAPPAGGPARAAG